jgi:hypothetical protein
MSESEEARTRDERYRDRRADERFDINATGGCLNYKNSKFPCKIIDVSLSGCCVRTERQFLPGNLAHVEVVLPIMGLVLRMVGTTQWLTRNNLIGVRFSHSSSRSRNQLAGLLTCLVDQNAAEEVKAAVVTAAQSGNTFLDVEFPDDWLRKPKPAPIADKAPKPERLAPPPPAKTPAKKDESGRRKEKESEWPAVLRVLKDGFRMAGAIVDLSLEGCSFRTVQPFVAGIHVRVEVDFQMRGLPFLLGGVTEDVRDRRIVDIHFIEMSFRKRKELAELIDEIREAGKTQAGELP